MEMKLCSKCGEGKSLESFYKDKQNKDGLRSWCKHCILQSTQKYKEENKEVVSKRNLKYKSQNHVKERSKESRKKYLVSHPDRVKMSRKIWRDNSNEKRKAHHQVRKAIQDGFIVRNSKCEYCGKQTFTEAHHINYERPLDILWLCKECHEVEEVLRDYYKKHITHNILRMVE